MKRFLFSIASLMLATTASAEYLLKRIETATGDPTYPYRQEIRLLVHTTGDRVYSALNPRDGGEKISGYPASQGHDSRPASTFGTTLVEAGGMIFDQANGLDGGPIYSYISPGISTYADVQSATNNCGGLDYAAFSNTVNDWESGSDGRSGLLAVGNAGCNVGADDGSGVLIAVFVSENRIQDFKLQLRVYNSAGSDSTWKNNVRILEADVSFSGAASNDITCIPDSHVFASDGEGYGVGSSALGSALSGYDCTTALANYQPDCNGNFPPVDEEDACGVCGGDNSTCTGCTDDSYCNYDATATIADNDSCEMDSCKGCQNTTDVWYLPKDGYTSVPPEGQLDRCGVCGGDGSSCALPCQYHSPSDLFPEWLIYVSENSDNNTIDGNVSLHFNWDPSAQAAQTNYYLLDAASSGSAFNGAVGSINPLDLLNDKTELAGFIPVGFTDFNLTSAASGQVADSTGTGGGSITTDIQQTGEAGSFVYEGPLQNVAIMIGAASSCITGRGGSDYIYMRSVYKFNIQERLSLERTVDATGFATYRTQYDSSVSGQEPLLVTQADLTQQVQTFRAQHVMKTRDLEVHSALDGPTDDHVCLGANNGAAASYAVTHESADEVAHDNSETTCTVTATGDISHFVQAGDNRAPGYDDTDIDSATNDAGEGNVVFNDFYIALALSQYTQMNAIADSSTGSTWADIMAVWNTDNCDDTDCHGAKDGYDVRADLCYLKRHNLGGTGTDVTDLAAIDDIDLDEHDGEGLPSAERDHTAVTNDASVQGTWALNDEAHVKCSFSPFQLDSSPSGVTGAEYSPNVYVRAWFDYGKGDLESEYGGNRRLRSAKKLTSALHKNTMHYMHIRLARKH